MITRIHNSELPIKRWNRKPVIQTNIIDRPVGLWYSIDNSWKNFCLDSGNNQWIGRYNYKVNLLNANVLKLLSVGGVRRFGEIYGERGRFNTFIHWGRVAMDFDGIEIQDYKADWFNTVETNWIFTWDCASGCIWNLKDVKIKKL